MTLSERLFGSRGVACGVALMAAATALAGCSAGVIDAVELAPGALFEGLIAHWTFDDGTGTTVADSTASHHDGTLLPLGTIWLPGEHFGGALHFDGTDQSEVQVPGFQKPSGSWSVAGWIRAPAGDTGNTYATIISTEIAGVGGWQLNLGLAPPVPTNPMNTISLYQFAYSTGTGLDYIFENCECFVPDAWVHIAGIFDTDRQTISLYQNGIFAGSKTAQQGILQGSDILYFGTWGSDSLRHLTGDLDDFVVYNRALTQPEVKQLVRAPLPATPPAP